MVARRAAESPELLVEQSLRTAADAVGVLDALARVGTHDVRLLADPYDLAAKRFLRQVARPVPGLLGYECAVWRWLAASGDPPERTRAR